MWQESLFFNVLLNDKKSWVIQLYCFQLEAFQQKQKTVYTRLKHTTTQKSTQNVCGIKARGTVLLLAGSALEKCPGLSHIQSMCP